MVNSALYDTLFSKGGNVKQKGGASISNLLYEKKLFW